MGLMGRVERSALRANMPGPLDDFWYQNVGGQVTYAGLPVSPDVAMRVSVVHACVEVMSMTLASLPLCLYRRLGDTGREKAKDHELYPILAYRPNSWQTRFEFIEYLVRNLYLRAGGFAEKDFQEQELLPIHPDRVTVEQLDNRQLRYRVKQNNAPERIMTQEQMLYIRDASDDAISGLSRTILAREAIAVAAAAERFSARWLQNDGTGRVIAKHPNRLDPTTRAEFHRVYQENSAGWSNRGKMLLAEGGVEYTVLPGLEDSGFLIDPRNFQIKEICRFFGRVPPFMIGHEDKTTWGKNIEEIKGGFVTFCAKPAGDRIEQALMRDLLDDDEREDYFIAFDYGELLRGDLLSTVQALAIEKQMGVVSPNEARAKLNMNPRTDPGGDEYQDTPAGAAPNIKPAGGQAAPPAAPEDDEEEVAAAIPATMMADAVDRITNAEVREVGKHATFAASDPAKFATWAGKFYGKQRAYAVKVLSALGLAVWSVEQAAERIEATAVSALKNGIPEGWAERRRAEVADVIDETFRAAAAMRKAA